MNWASTLPAMPSKKLPASVQRLVRLRANNLCEYCLAPNRFSFHSFRTDHITPTSKGGNDDPDNLAHTCDFCNGSKHDKTQASDPMTGAVVPLFHPRKDAWSDHFVWSDDSTIIIGLSPVGRATVACLKMNKPAARNLRAALRDFGVHPPT